MSPQPRVILHLDMDAFYATVLENANPALRLLPLGVQQKGILATCNYVARSRGVKKLQLLSEAKKVCKDLVIVNGEDLTRFRNVSKKVWLWVREVVWGGLVERLGLDELFVDATEMVDFNLELGGSFFRLSKTDSTVGFTYNLTEIPGCVHPTPPFLHDLDLQTKRLLLGAHLTSYLRVQILQNFAHPMHAGISVSKVASKLVGNLHKPANQTVLLPCAFSTFLGNHELAEIPGIGSKTARKLRAAVHRQLCTAVEAAEEAPVDVKTALKVLTPERISNILGTTIGSATHIANLLHGVDSSPIPPAPLYPTQISIEDTFRPLTLRTLSQTIPVLAQLLTKLLQRIQTDLLISSPSSSTWAAHPRNLRISIRLHETDSWNRISRSTLLPTYVFAKDADIPMIARRLCTETALPVLKRLVPAPPKEWSLQLLNVAAVNMVPSGGAGGGDIRAFLTPSSESPRDEEGKHLPEHSDYEEFEEFEDTWDSGSDDIEISECSICHTEVPSYALEAHARFHANNPQPPPP